MGKRLFDLILSFFIFVNVSCGSKGDTTNGGMDRASELKHYFAGVAEIATEGAVSLPIVNAKISDIVIDAANLSVVDAGLAFDLIRTVKLETERSNLIGNVDKLIYADSIFYILDRDMGKSVYAFDNDGNYIASIGYAGRGPEEYIEPTDIFYDDNSDHLVVWDQFTHRFLAYNHRGEFVYSRGVPLRFLRCEMLAGDTTIWCSYMTVNGGVPDIDGYNLVALDSLSSAVVAMYDYNPMVMNYIPMGTNMRSFNNSIYYHPQFSDTIYQLNDNCATPCFALSFNHISELPDNIMELCEGNYENFISRFGGAAVGYFENDFLITDKRVYLEINLGNDILTVCYPYSAHSNSDGIESDIAVLLPNIYSIFNTDRCQACNLPWGNLNSCTYDGEFLYAAVNCSLTRLLSRQEREYLKLYEMDEDNNPVILVMKER